MFCSECRQLDASRKELGLMVIPGAEFECLRSLTRKLEEAGLKHVLISLTSRTPIFFGVCKVLPDWKKSTVSESITQSIQVESLKCFSCFVCKRLLGTVPFFYGKIIFEMGNYCSHFCCWEISHASIPPVFPPNQGLSDYDFIQSPENCITSDFNCYHQAVETTMEGLRCVFFTRFCVTFCVFVLGNRFFFVR